MELLTKKERGIIQSVDGKLERLMCEKCEHQRCTKCPIFLLAKRLYIYEQAEKSRKVIGLDRNKFNNVQYEKYLIVQEAFLIDKHYVLVVVDDNFKIGQKIGVYNYKFKLITTANIKNIERDVVITSRGRCCALELVIESEDEPEIFKDMYIRKH